MTETIRHTAGPFTAKFENGVYWIDGADGEPVAKLYTDEWTAKTLVQQINTQPELLEACQAVLLDYDNGTLTVERREALRAAITKATT